MKKSISIILVSLFFSAAVSTASAGAYTAEIAKIMMDLNHQPSATEKQTLKDIIRNQNSSMSEKVIANALVKMNHRVNSNSAADLKELPNHTRDAEAIMLAKILLNLNHKPSNSDKKQLKSLIGK